MDELVKLARSMDETHLLITKRPSGQVSLSFPKPAVVYDTRRRGQLLIPCVAIVTLGLASYFGFKTWADVHKANLKADSEEAFRAKIVEAAKTIPPEPTPRPRTSSCRRTARPGLAATTASTPSA